MMWTSRRVKCRSWRPREAGQRFCYVEKWLVQVGGVWGDGNILLWTSVEVEGLQGHLVRGV